MVKGPSLDQVPDSLGQSDSACAEQEPRRSPRRVKGIGLGPTTPLPFTPEQPALSDNAWNAPQGGNFYGSVLDTSSDSSLIAGHEELKDWATYALHLRTTERAKRQAGAALAVEDDSSLLSDEGSFQALPSPDAGLNRTPGPVMRVFPESASRMPRPVAGDGDADEEDEGRADALRSRRSMVPPSALASRGRSALKQSAADSINMRTPNRFPAVGAIGAMVVSPEVRSGPLLSSAAVATPKFSSRPPKPFFGASPGSADTPDSAGHKRGECDADDCIAVPNAETSPFSLSRRTPLISISSFKIESSPSPSLGLCHPPLDSATKTPAPGVRSSITFQPLVEGASPRALSQSPDTPNLQGALFGGYANMRAASLGASWATDSPAAAMAAAGGAWGGRPLCEAGAPSPDGGVVAGAYASAEEGQHLSRSAAPLVCLPSAEAPFQGFAASDPEAPLESPVMLLQASMFSTANALGGDHSRVLERGPLSVSAASAGGDDDGDLESLQAPGLQAVGAGDLGHRQAAAPSPLRPRTSDPVAYRPRQRPALSGRSPSPYKSRSEGLVLAGPGSSVPPIQRALSSPLPAAHPTYAAEADDDLAVGGLCESPSDVPASPFTPGKTASRLALCENASEGWSPSDALSPPPQAFGLADGPVAGSFAARMSSIGGADIACDSPSSPPLEESPDGARSPLYTPKTVSRIHALRGGDSPAQSPVMRRDIYEDAGGGEVPGDSSLLDESHDPAPATPFTPKTISRIGRRSLDLLDDISGPSSADLGVDLLAAMEQAVEQSDKSSLMLEDSPDRVPPTPLTPKTLSRFGASRQGPVEDGARHMDEGLLMAPSASAAPAVCLADENSPALDASPSDAPLTPITPKTFSRTPAGLAGAPCMDEDSTLEPRSLDGIFGTASEPSSPVAAFAPFGMPATPRNITTRLFGDDSPPTSPTADVVCPVFRGTVAECVSTEGKSGFAARSAASPPWEPITPKTASRLPLLSASDEEDPAARAVDASDRPFEPPAPGAETARRSSALLPRSPVPPRFRVLEVPERLAAADDGPQWSPSMEATDKAVKPPASPPPAELEHQRALQLLDEDPSTGLASEPPSTRHRMSHAKRSLAPSPASAARSLRLDALPEEASFPEQVILARRLEERFGAPPEGEEEEKLVRRLSGAMDGSQHVASTLDVSLTASERAYLSTPVHHPLLRLVDDDEPSDCDEPSAEDVLRYLGAAADGTSSPPGCGTPLAESPASPTPSVFNQSLPATPKIQRSVRYDHGDGSLCGTPVNGARSAAHTPVRSASRPLSRSFLAEELADPPVTPSDMADKPRRLVAVMAAERPASLGPGFIHRTMSVEDVPCSPIPRALTRSAGRVRPAGTPRTAASVESCRQSPAFPPASLASIEALDEVDSLMWPGKFTPRTLARLFEEAAAPALRAPSPTPSGRSPASFPTAAPNLAGQLIGALTKRPSAPPSAGLPPRHPQSPAPRKTRSAAPSPCRLAETNKGGTFAYMSEDHSGGGVLPSLLLPGATSVGMLPAGISPPVHLGLALTPETEPEAAASQPDTGSVPPPAPDSPGECRRVRFDFDQLDGPADGGLHPEGSSAHVSLSLGTEGSSSVCHGSAVSPSNSPTRQGLGLMEPVSIGSDSLPGRDSDAVDFVPGFLRSPVSSACGDDAASEASEVLEGFAHGAAGTCASPLRQDSAALTAFLADDQAPKHDVFCRVESFATFVTRRSSSYTGGEEDPVVAAASAAAKERASVAPVPEEAEGEGVTADESMGENSVVGPPPLVPSPMRSASCSVVLSPGVSRTTISLSGRKRKSFLDGCSLAQGSECSYSDVSLGVRSIAEQIEGAAALENSTATSHPAPSAEGADDGTPPPKRAALALSPLEQLWKWGASLTAAAPVQPVVQPLSPFVSVIKKAPVRGPAEPPRFPVGSMSAGPKSSSGVESPATPFAFSTGAATPWDGGAVAFSPFPSARSAPLFFTPGAGLSASPDLGKVLTWEPVGPTGVSISCSSPSSGATDAKADSEVENALRTLVAETEAYVEGLDAAEGDRRQGLACRTSSDSLPVVPVAQEATVLPGESRALAATTRNNVPAPPPLPARFQPRPQASKCLAASETVLAAATASPSSASDAGHPTARNPIPPPPPLPKRGGARAGVSGVTSQPVETASAAALDTAHSAAKRGSGQPPPPPLPLRKGPMGKSMNVAGGPPSPSSMALTPGRPPAGPFSPAAHAGFNVRRRMVHWEPVGQPAPNTIWAREIGPAAEPPLVDCGALERLFSKLSPVKRIGTPVDPVRQGPAPLTLTPRPVVSLSIDVKRKTNTEILLSGLPTSDLAEVSAAVRSLDAASIGGRRAVDALSRAIPPHEELEYIQRSIREYLASGGDIESLGRAERFFHIMSTIDNLPGKLRVMRFRHTLQEIAPELITSYRGIAVACDEVCSSQSLRALLALVLQLGNSLNGPAGRGPALGIRVASLSRLQTTKAFNRSDINLLHMLVAQSMRVDPHLVDRLGSELSGIKRASKYSWSELQEEMQEVQMGLKSVEEELAVQRSAPGSGAAGEAGAIRQLRCFLEEARQVRDILVQSQEGARARFGELLQFFGEPVPRDFETAEPRGFFGSLGAFIQDIHGARLDKAAVGACV